MSQLKYKQQYLTVLSLLEVEEAYTASKGSSLACRELCTLHFAHARSPGYIWGCHDSSWGVGTAAASWVLALEL